MTLSERLKHFLTGCRGWPDHEVDADGVNWIGLRCVQCGKLKSKTLSRFQSTEAGRRALGSPPQ